MQMTPEPPSDGRATDHSRERKPSLLDDLYSDPAKREKELPKTRAEEDLSHPPSLVEDVFLSEPPKARKRFPVWLFVLGAILLTVVGSLLMYRSNTAAPPAWKEEPKPKLEMATPPPVPPLPGESQGQAVSKEPVTTEAGAAKMPSEPPRQAPPLAKPSAQGPPGVTQPARAPQSVQGRVTAKAGNPPIASESGTKAGDKPKLLREPEDLAKEQRAFDLLREKSQAARQLLDGNLEQFQFLQYEVIPKEAGHYWVDLVAAQKGTNLAVHFIWAVNPDKQTAKALSQAARDIDH